MATFTSGGDSVTLGVEPSIEQYEYNLAVDPTIRNRTDAGYEITRSRASAVKRMWRLRYVPISRSEKEDLHAFIEAVGVGGSIVTWNDPADDSDPQEDISVRFAETPVYTPWYSWHHYAVDLMIEEM